MSAFTTNWQFAWRYWEYSQCEMAEDCYIINIFYLFLVEIIFLAVGAMLVVAVLGKRSWPNVIRFFRIVIMKVQQMIQALFLASMIENRVQFDIGVHQSGGLVWSSCFSPVKILLSRRTLVIVKVIVAILARLLFADIIFWLKRFTTSRSWKLFGGNIWK